MAPTTTIPRFLLPQSSPMWRRLRLPVSVAFAGPADRTAATQLLLVRHASSKRLPPSSKAPKATPPAAASKVTTADGTIVLEKPEKFVPPSHGARLPRGKVQHGQHFGGDLSPEELKLQETRSYPGMMAPKGSFEWRFWHNRTLHAILTIGTLFGLAFWTTWEHFKDESAYSDMLPNTLDYITNPITSVQTLVKVLTMTQYDKNLRIQAKRELKAEDVQKRHNYRVAHGIDQEGGWFSWVPRMPQPPRGPTEEELAAERAIAKAEALSVPVTDMTEKKDRLQVRTWEQYKAWKEARAHIDKEALGKDK